MCKELNISFQWALKETVAFVTNYVKYVKYVDVLNNRDVGFLVEVKDGDGDVDK